MPEVDPTPQKVALKATCSKSWESKFLLPSPNPSPLHLLIIMIDMAFVHSMALIYKELQLIQINRNLK